jgi:hypothetical protein
VVLRLVRPLAADAAQNELIVIREWAIFAPPEILERRALLVVPVQRALGHAEPRGSDIVALERRTADDDALGVHLAAALIDRLVYVLRVREACGARSGCLRTLAISILLMIVCKTTIFGAEMTIAICLQGWSRQTCIETAKQTLTMVTLLIPTVTSPETCSGISRPKLLGETGRILHAWSA